VADELDRREDRELEMIQRQMEQTRANLGDKLEKLESHVVGTVNAATETVSDAVQGVKDVVGTVTESVAAVSTTVTDTAAAVSETVSGTVASVTDSLNIAKHIEAHPWGAMGAAVGLGFLGSLLLGSSEKKEQPSSSSASSNGSWFHAPAAKGAPSESLLSSAPASSDASWLSQDSPVGKLLGQATEGVTGLALNSIMGVVRQLTASLPESFREPANQFVDNMATDLGVPHKVLAENPPIQPSSQESAAKGAPQQSRQPDNPALARSRASLSA
jgi:ElaB/YqjD/DUF883 family membrane-anchored ribosome-binding protein